MQSESHFTQGCPILMRPVVGGLRLSSLRTCSPTSKLSESVLGEVKRSPSSNQPFRVPLEAGRRRGGNGVDASSTRGGEREPPLS